MATRVWGVQTQPLEEPNSVVRELVHTFNLPHVQREAGAAWSTAVLLRQQ